VKRWIPIVLAVVVVGGLVFLSLARRDRSPRVDTAAIELRELTATVRASGTIQPKRQVNVSANTIGTITHLAIEEGQRVQAGDLLLQIDPTEYLAAVNALEASVLTGEADLRLAQASLEKAEIDHRRARELFAQNLTSEENLLAAATAARVEAARVEAARHRLAQVRANLQKAQHDLQKVTITAPMTGLITRLNVEEGENAIMGTLNNPGTVLLTIADMGTLEAVVEVDETEVVQVALGQPATVEIDAFPGREFAGRVTEIGNSPIRSGGTQQAVDFLVKVTLDEAPGGMRPGLSAKARITTALRDASVAVPLGAVTARDWPLRTEAIEPLKGGRARERERALEGLGFSTEAAAAATPRRETEGVFVIRDGFVKFMPVVLGIAGQDHFEVLEGLEPGETIVAGPFRVLRELRDGAPVRELQDPQRRRGRTAGG
jgi:HlyD family secretion protein